MRWIQKFWRRVVGTGGLTTIVSVLLAGSIAAAYVQLDGPACLPHHVQLPFDLIERADTWPYVILDVRCGVDGVHGNYAYSGTTAYTNTYFEDSTASLASCDHVSGRATYAFGGNVFNAPMRTTYYEHTWAPSSEPSGPNRPIVGSTFWASRTGSYSISASTSAIGC